MKRIVTLILMMLLLFGLYACGKPTPREKRLSASCDYVLCDGTDTAGDYYELVANQEETALGYEITVGVIKNNTWLYPLSNGFPFLEEKGLFHVSAPQGRQSGVDLSGSNHIDVASSIRFLDSGTFMMNSYNNHNLTGWERYKHTKIFFSCSSLKSYTIACEEYEMHYYSMNDSIISSDCTIYTDNGKVLLYSRDSEDRSKTEDVDYYWYLLDTKELQVEQIAATKDVFPESALSEGLIFASDKCFYDVNMRKIIDLSDYNIDMFYDSNLYFQNGQCTFKTKNYLGTEFFVTIDKTGKVISEVAA